MTKSWPDPDPALQTEVNSLRAAALGIYKENKLLLQEHINQEDSYRTGGYSERQLLELVQNAADAILRGSGGGRIELRLSQGNLYCANEGAPFTAAGIQAVTHAFLSNKRGDEIGRFGLGFKSVLSVSDEAQVLSRSISFDFNSESSRAAIRGVSGSHGPTPILRVPSLLSFEAVASEDPVVAEMASWATTIIRLPNVSHIDRLREQLRAFRTEFLLFAPKVTALRLVVEDVTDGIDLDHRRESVGSQRVDITTPNSDRSEWLLIERMHTPSARARSEVGEAVARESIKLSYAAPMTNSGGLGRFWAYFPLRDETTASGLFNAPWRVNDDRTSLLAGTYNGEIYEQFAQMVVEALPLLSTEKDPARHFDYMPARGKESRSDADRILSARIPELARDQPLIPDAEGKLRISSELRWLAPKYQLDRELMAGWQSSDLAPTDFPHPFCYSTQERRTRLANLTENVAGSGELHKSELQFAEWLTLLNGDVASMATALQILGRQKDQELRLLGGEARIVLGSNGHRFKANAIHHVFLGGELTMLLPGLDVIDASLVSITGVKEVLVSLGFHEVTPDRELAGLLRGASAEWGTEEWTLLWDLADSVPADRLISLFKNHVRSDGVLRVKTEDGRWTDPASVVLPIQGVFNPRSSSLRLDTQFHGRDARLLRSTGVVCGVEALYPTREDALYQEYRAWANETFQKSLVRDSKATTGDGTFSQEYGPGPIFLLKSLRLAEDWDALAGWSSAILRTEGDRQWTLSRSGEPRASQDFPAPHLWAIQTYGLLNTSWGVREPRLTMSPMLHNYADYLPIAQETQAGKLGLIGNVETVPRKIWIEFLGRTPDGSNPQILGGLIVRALRSLDTGEIVSQVPAVETGTPTIASCGSLVIATSREETLFLATRQIPFIQISDPIDVNFVVDRLGCIKASDYVSFSEVTEGMGDPVLAVDRFRGLRRLPGNPLREVQFIECERIAKRISARDGVEDSPVQHLRHGSLVYIQRATDDEDILAILNAEFQLNLGGLQRSQLLTESVEADKQLLMERCRAESNDGRRILLMFSPEELENKLPAGLMKTIRAMNSPSGPLDIADLFLNVYGNGSLEELKFDLQGKGLPAPDRWAGGREALTFVRQVGFSPAFAGEMTRSLQASLLVPGRPGLRALHPYQEDLANQIRSVLRSGDGDSKKAMLYLPTGAGKTRVTVEAIVRSFLADEIHGPVLWIAQSEELCEQAVQTWAEVWSDFADKRSMNIGRLWASNAVTDANSDLTVVVATDQKLRHLVDDYEYDWLKKAAAVIVDEAHVAGDSTMYTRIFRWLGVDGRSSERPLLGLTATPFKNFSEERTKSLVARFGKKRLDAFNEEDPYVALQRMGVLSQVQHFELPGAMIELDESEQQFANNPFARLADTVLKRVGDDSARTARLVKHIAELDPSWPVLVFTSSILSAQVLAALLRARGVEAASVSGETRTHERRRIIRDFKENRIQVLTNCDVLTQGFDAPGVKALYLARPTLSPNAYIQMVGRGLRGPLNGGEPECLIVDVVDTFSNFHGELAFRKFDYLWDR